VDTKYIISASACSARPISRSAIFDCPSFSCSSFLLNLQSHNLRECVIVLKCPNYKNAQCKLHLRLQSNIKGPKTTFFLAVFLATALKIPLGDRQIWLLGSRPSDKLNWSKFWRDTPALPLCNVYGSATECRTFNASTQFHQRLTFACGRCIRQRQAIYQLQQLCADSSPASCFCIFSDCILYASLYAGLYSRQGPMLEPF